MSFVWNVVRRILPVSTVTAVVICIIVIGTLRLKVINGGEPTIERMLSDAQNARIGEIYEGQKDVILFFAFFTFLEYTNNRTRTQ